MAIVRCLPFKHLNLSKHGKNGKMAIENGHHSQVTISKRIEHIEGLSNINPHEHCEHFMPDNFAWMGQDSFESFLREMMSKNLGNSNFQPFHARIMHVQSSNENCDFKPSDIPHDIWIRAISRGPVTSIFLPQFLRS